MEKSSSKASKFPNASQLRPGDIISWCYNNSIREWVLVIGKMHWKKRYNDLDPVLEIPVVYFGKRAELKTLNFLNATFYDDLTKRSGTMVVQLNEEK